MIKKWRVYVAYDDLNCTGRLEFEAHSAILVDKRTLLVDGKRFMISEVFFDLQEGWVN